MSVANATSRWPDRESALSHLERVRWKRGVVCPYCGSDKVGPHREKKRTVPRRQCRSCHRSFSPTVGTMFHHTHLPLQIWFLAAAMILEKKKVSNRRIAREMDIPVKTAWTLSRRIRSAVANDPAQERLLRAIIEGDGEHSDVPRDDDAPGKDLAVAKKARARRVAGSGYPDPSPERETRARRAR